MHPNFRLVFLTAAMTSAAIPAVAQAELVGIIAILFDIRKLFRLETPENCL